MQPVRFSSSKLISIVGCTRKTLRVLEEARLIRPVYTTGRKRYSRESVRRLWLIVTLQGLGFSIERITAMLENPQLAHDAGAAADAYRATVDRIVNRIDGRLRDLQDVREALVGARRTLEECSPCQRTTDDCRTCAASGRLDTVSELLLARLGNLAPTREANPGLAVTAAEER